MLQKYFLNQGTFTFKFKGLITVIASKGGNITQHMKLC